MAGKGSLMHPIVTQLRAAMVSGGGWTDEHLAEMGGLAAGAGYSEEDVDRPGLRRPRRDGEAPRHAAGPRRRHGLHGPHLAERLGLPEHGAHAQRRRER